MVPSTTSTSNITSSSTVTSTAPIIIAIATPPLPSDPHALTQPKRCSVDGCTGWSFIGNLCKHHRRDLAETEAASKRGLAPHSYCTQHAQESACQCADVLLTQVEVTSVTHIQAHTFSHKAFRALSVHTSRAPPFRPTSSAPSLRANGRSSSTATPAALSSLSCKCVTLRIIAHRQLSLRSSHFVETLCPQYLLLTAPPVSKRSDSGRPEERCCDAQYSRSLPSA